MQIGEPRAHVVENERSSRKTEFIFSFFGTPLANARIRVLFSDGSSGVHDLDRHGWVRVFHPNKLVSRVELLPVK